MSPGLQLFESFGLENNKKRSITISKRPNWHLKIVSFVRPTAQNPKIFSLQLYKMDKRGKSSHLRSWRKRLFWVFAWYMKFIDQNSLLCAIKTKRALNWACFCIKMGYRLFEPWSVLSDEYLHLKTEVDHISHVRFCIYSQTVYFAGLTGLSRQYCLQMVMSLCPMWGEPLAQLTLLRLWHW